MQARNSPKPMCSALFPSALSVLAALLPFVLRCRGCRSRFYPPVPSAPRPSNFKLHMSKNNGQFLSRYYGNNLCKPKILLHNCYANLQFCGALWDKIHRCSQAPFRVVRFWDLQIHKNNYNISYKNPKERRLFHVRGKNSGDCAH